MNMNGQLHAPAASTLGKGLPICIEEVGCDLGLVENKNISAQAGNLFPIFQFTT
jgi:hypothetical protein